MVALGSGANHKTTVAAAVSHISNQKSNGQLETFLDRSLTHFQKNTWWAPGKGSAGAMVLMGTW